MVYSSLVVAYLPEIKRIDNRRDILIDPDVKELRCILYHSILKTAIAFTIEDKATQQRQRIEFTNLPHFLF